MIGDAGDPVSSDHGETVIRCDWPPHYPEGCPPAEASGASGIVYRYVSQDPPKSEDFRARSEEQPAKQFGSKRCQASGLSVFRDPRDLDRLKRRVPAYRDSLVACATLTADHGVILATPTKNGSSHHTWWVPLGVAAASAFRICLTHESLTEDR